MIGPQFYLWQEWLFCCLLDRVHEPSLWDWR